MIYCSTPRKTNIRTQFFLATSGFYLGFFVWGEVDPEKKF